MSEGVIIAIISASAVVVAAIIGVVTWNKKSGKKPDITVNLPDSEIQKETLERIKQIEEKLANQGIEKTKEDLLKENKELRERLEKESVASVSPDLQANIDKLFGEFRYEETRKIIGDFMSNNDNIKQNDLAKLHYQKSLTFEAEINYLEAKEELENFLLALEK